MGFLGLCKGFRVFKLQEFRGVMGLKCLGSFSFRTLWGFWA